MIIILGISGCIYLALLLIKRGYTKKEAISWAFYVASLFIIFSLTVAIPLVWGGIEQETELTKTSFSYKSNMNLAKAEIDKAVKASANDYKILYHRFSTKDTVATHFTVWPIYVHKKMVHTWKVIVYEKKPYNW